MSMVTTIGLDIAKSVFQVRGISATGEVLIRRNLKTSFFPGFAPSLATSICHGAESAIVQTVMQHHSIQLSDLDRRRVARQDLATIRNALRLPLKSLSAGLVVAELVSRREFDATDAVH